MSESAPLITTSFEEECGNPIILFLFDIFSAKNIISLNHGVSH